MSSSIDWSYLTSSDDEGCIAPPEPALDAKTGAYVWEVTEQHLPVGIDAFRVHDTRSVYASATSTVKIVIRLKRTHAYAIEVRRQIKASNPFGTGNVAKLSSTAWFHSGTIWWWSGMRRANAVCLGARGDHGEQVKVHGACLSCVYEMALGKVIEEEKRLDREAWGTE